MWTRPIFLILLTGITFVTSLNTEGADVAGPKKFRVYIGTYTGGNSRGIYQSTLDVFTGELLPPQLAAEIVNPSFVAIHPNQKFLYAVSETADFEGRKTGAVTAFSIDESTGALKVLNQQASEGMHPCHLVVDATGKNVLLANYSSGTIAVLPIENPSGRISKASTVIQHMGSSVDKQRQEGPHAHSINLDPANRFALAADLGLDKILVYQFDAVAGTLMPNDPPAGVVAPGSGPRHLAFHPTGKYVYVNNEMTSGITAFTYDAGKGSLTEIHTLSTIPGDVPGNSTAETVVHPSGLFVYVSNRGHNSIAIFQCDPATGRLTARGHTPTGGKTPRNFNVDPTGMLLLAANQDSNDITVFRIHPQTGSLTATETKVEVGNPVCLRFLPLKN